MPKTTDLKAILENVLAGKATAEELQAVRRAISSGKVVFTAGSRNVASETVKKSIIIIGNRNELKVEASPADYDRLQKQFFATPSAGKRLRRLLKAMRRAKAFLPWLFTAIAINLITEFARRFLSDDLGWLDTAAVIIRYLFAMLAAAAGALAIAAVLLPAHLILRKVFSLGMLKRSNTNKAILITGIALVLAIASLFSLPLFARLYNERGSQYQNREQPDLDAARKLYKQALKLNPDSGQTHYNLASTYEESEPERAIEEYTIAIRYDGNISSAYTRLAYLYNKKGYQYHMQGLVSDALELYQQALNSDQTYAEAHYNLGVAYEDSHELSKAKEEYQIAIKYDNRLIRAHNNLARLYLSTGNDKQDYKDALDLLRDALNQSPKNEEDLYSLYKNFGWANYALGNLDIAEGYLNGAIRLRPEKAAAHCLLAYMLKRLGRARAAAENCYVCVSNSYDEKDVEPIWVTDAQQSFEEGRCNEAK